MLISFLFLDENILMSTHNICFRREIRKILCGYPFLSVAMLIRLSDFLMLQLIWAVPSEIVTSSMRKMHIFRFILCTCKVSCGHLLSIDTFYNVQWFCQRTVKALIRLRRCIWEGVIWTQKNQDSQLIWLLLSECKEPTSLKAVLQIGI